MTSLYPLVRFVSEMSTTATVRFDFHAPGETSTDPREWSWTPGGLLGEPDGINPSYGLGRLEFNLQVHTTHADAVRVMAALAREIRRGRNYLLFQFDAFTAPAWVEVYPSSPGALGFPYASPESDENAWIIPVGLTTSGTWIGEQVTETVTVNNDPAVADGLAVELPEIKGDAPAPLVVELPDIGTGEQIQPLLSVMALDADWPGVQAWQAESLVLATDATVVADAAFSGGSKVSISFGTTAWASRIETSTTFKPAFAGTYRLFARVVSTAAAGAISVRGAGLSLVSQVTTDLADATDGQLVELGTYAFPKGNPPLEPGYTLRGTNDVVTLEATRNSGSASLAVDYLVAVPIELFETVEARLLEFGEPTTLPYDRHVVNGEHDRVSVMSSTYGLLTTDAPSVRGSFPVVVPGVTNVLHLLLQRLDFWGAIPAVPVSGSGSVTLKYRPRHVYLPGA